MHANSFRMLADRLLDESAALRASTLDEFGDASLNDEQLLPLLGFVLGNERGSVRDSNPLVAEASVIVAQTVGLQLDAADRGPLYELALELSKSEDLDKELLGNSFVGSIPLDSEHYILLLRAAVERDSPDLFMVCWHHLNSYTEVIAKNSSELISRVEEGCDCAPFLIELLTAALWRRHQHCLHPLLVLARDGKLSRLALRSLCYSFDSFGLVLDDVDTSDFFKDDSTSSEEEEALCVTQFHLEADLLDLGTQSLSELLLREEYYTLPEREQIDLLTAVLKRTRSEWVRDQVITELAKLVKQTPVEELYSSFSTLETIGERAQRLIPAVRETIGLLPTHSAEHRKGTRLIKILTDVYSPERVFQDDGAD